MLTRSGRRRRGAIKRFVYSQLYMRDALLIMLGRAKPLVRFKVEAAPPSVYFNFEIAPDRVERLEREIDLPHPLTPIRCIEGEEPFHCLTLNVYRVSGLASGIRAEWSVYVRGPDGKPRYLILEARADAGSMDPIHIITRPGRVTHEHSDEWLTSEVFSEGDTRIRTRCRWAPDAPAVRAAAEWIEANDYIYWMNGVCDRTFYDSGLANARPRQLDVADVSIENDTSWSRYVEGAPRHVLVFEEAIEFAMSPWWNLDELAR